MPVVRQDGLETLRGRKIGVNDEGLCATQLAENPSCYHLAFIWCLAKTNRHEPKNREIGAISSHTVALKP